MAKEVVLSPLAIINYENIINYLTVKWGTTVANNFVERFQIVIELLSDDSNIYSFIDKNKKIQKCVVTKHNVLYFRKTKDIVKIITVFDTRQNPDKLKSII
ncbi:MAG TPA: type II toxin-antitoxin system RelE/ParE family toxin [Mucilaginibacter sp.]